MPEFRDKFRNEPDLLLLDNFSFISGKQATQEAMLSILDLLTSEGRQLVIASCDHPMQLDLCKKLQSRLLGGLIAKLRHPESIEERLDLTRSLSNRQELTLSDQQIRLLAEYPTHNAREIEGLLIRIKAESSLSDRPVNDEMIASILSDNAIHRKVFKKKIRATKRTKKKSKR